MNLEKEKEIIIEAMADFREKGGTVINKKSVSKDGKCLCPLACVGRFHGITSNDPLDLFKKTMEVLNWNYNKCLAFMRGVDDYIYSSWDQEYFDLGKEILKEI